MSEHLYEENITLKEVILKLRELRKELFRKWYLLLAFVVVFAVVGAILTFVLPPKYSGKLSFVVEEPQAANPLAAYSNIASQFGFDLGGGSTTFSADNLIELLKTRKIVEEALLRKQDLDSAGNLIQHYIQFKKLYEKWEDEPKLKKIRFDIPKSQFTYRHDSLMNKFYETMVEKHLKVKNVSSTSSLIEINCESENEQFSKYFVEGLVESVSNFYTNNKTQRARETLNFIEGRTDSIYNALTEAELELARWKDSKKSIIKAEGYLTELRLMRKVEILNTMYGEAVKNLELAKVSLLNQTPLIQVIDKPILPLEDESMSLPLSIVVFGFIGGLFGSGLVVTRKVIRDAMEEN